MSFACVSCCDMYTEFCRSLASCGYIVIALEHEDGSGVHATKPDGTQVRYMRPDSTPYSREKVSSFRAPQLQQRVDETESVLRYLLQNKTADSRSDSQSEAQTLEQVLRVADPSCVSLVGHSFGAGV